MNKKKNHKKKQTQKELNKENIKKGYDLLKENPLFYFYDMTLIHPTDKSQLGMKAYANVTSSGTILINTDLFLPPENWAFIIAHNMLHLAFGHFDADKMPGYIVTNEKGEEEKKLSFKPLLWNMACDIYINHFLNDVKIGKPLTTSPSPFVGNVPSSELQIYEKLLDEGISPDNNIYGTGDKGYFDMIGLNNPLTYDKENGEENLYVSEFAAALISSVTSVIRNESLNSYTADKSLSCPEASWFISHYPLLGGLAAHFKIIKDINYCNQNDIQVAAVDAELGEIYLNPAKQLSSDEWKFVLAHEYLHAGLMHHERSLGRDPYLWNVACDFVINGWLVELNVGSMPHDSLYDPLLKGLSAESIYDKLLEDIKKYEKLTTFRGYKKGDIIRGEGRSKKGGVSLDDFCKNALQQGLEYHINSHRGFLPAELIEEIRALSMPVIPWDVALAKWFEVYFTPLEKHRTYARPSRRQASTPDIPRPCYHSPDIPVDSRTFGVVIDTSASMTKTMLAKALGSVASYSEAHDVPFARVIFCDASAYDAGYLSPSDIGGRVQVKGRGGTILQPGIDALERAIDFPKDAPILIITDGECEEKLYIKRSHAFLLPKGNKLPFRAKGEVLYFQ